MGTLSHSPRRGSSSSPRFLLCGVVAPLLAPAYQSQADRAPALHRVRAGLGSGRRADGLQFLRQCAVRRASACMSRPSSRSGSSTMSGSTPRRRGGGTEFVFDAAPVPDRAGGRASGGGSRERTGRLAARLARAVDARALFRHLHARTRHRRRPGRRRHSVDRGGLWHAHAQSADSLGDVGLLLYYLCAWPRGRPARLPSPGCCRPVSAWRSTPSRDDEDKAEAMGLKTHAAKVTAWVIAAAFLGVAGALYGNLVRFIDPIETAFAGADHRRVDDPDGAARRQGHAARAHRRRDRVPGHQGAVLDLSARLAARRARRADRSGRRVLPHGIVGFVRDRLPAKRRGRSRRGARAHDARCSNSTDVTKSFGGVRRQ